MDSIYPKTDMDKLGNRVQWTRFPCIETEFNELGLYTQKSSSMNSVSIHGNRVHWTRFCYWFICEIEDIKQQTALPRVDLDIVSENH